MKKEEAEKGQDAPAILFTGFPGFIGMRLLPRILELDAEARLECLVQEKFLELAKAAVATLEAQHEHSRGRIGLVVGDITRPASASRRSAPASSSARSSRRGTSRPSTTSRCGATSDAASTSRARRTCSSSSPSAPRFERLQYVSTAYVSGTHRGTFRETDLDVGQGFKNHYEETKFQAEVEVVRSQVPRTIFRPGRGGGRLEDGGDGQVRRAVPRAAADGEAALAGRLLPRRHGLRHREHRARSTS